MKNCSCMGSAMIMVTQVPKDRTYDRDCVEINGGVRLTCIILNTLPSPNGELLHHSFSQLIILLPLIAFFLQQFERSKCVVTWEKKV
ncbi:hypothetical protein Lal_00026331 [Lupinus albus]|nr:hypothetical protein Lal_00026331 [Lupinus albus]